MAPPKPKPTLPTPLAPANDGVASFFRHPLVVWIVGTLVTAAITGAVATAFIVVRSIYSRLGSLETEVAKLKQSVADGETHEIVSLLQSAKNPSAVAAQMALVTAEVRASVSEGKQPDQKKINQLAPAIVDAAKKYPDLPESWMAVSTLASYRTSQVSFPRNVQPESLPDCDISNDRTLFHPTDYGFPEPPGPNVNGYLYRDCKLYLDHLPGHSMLFRIAPPASGPDPFDGKGGLAGLGFPAYAVDVVIVWRGTLSDTDILFLRTLNCRFEFQENGVPTPVAQKLLLAALESPQPGSTQFPIAQ